MLPSRLWKVFTRLKHLGIMGTNCRNACYVFRAVPGPRFLCVDDKLATKRICAAHGIPVPKTYAVVRRYGDINRLAETVQGLAEFVIRPCMGSRGRGILVIRRRSNEMFECSGGRSLRIGDLQEHMAGLLWGLHSVNDAQDSAIIEQCVVPDSTFQRLGIDGVPDVRVIVYRGYAVMAMMRVPTVASGGRANLHQGAVGVGVDLGTGETSGGLWRNRAIDHHPDTGQPLAGFQVPQ